MSSLFHVYLLNKERTIPLEAISYYFGEDQADIENFKFYTSPTKNNVILANLITPHKEKQPHLFNDLPEYLKYNPKTKNKRKFVTRSRSVLWQQVSDREVRLDAQYARVLQTTIPNFLGKFEIKSVVENFANLLLEEGMIVDFAVHNQNKHESFKDICRKNSNNENLLGKKNYMGHFLCTLRPYVEGEFVNKNRDWNTKESLERWRLNWYELLLVAVKNSKRATPNQKQKWENKLSLLLETPNIYKSKIKL